MSNIGQSTLKVVKFSSKKHCGKFTERRAKYMRYLLFLIASCFVSCIGAEQRQNISTNLLENPGFEQGTAGWKVKIGPENQALVVASIDKTVFCEGKASLKLTKLRRSPNNKKEYAAIWILSSAESIDKSKPYTAYARIRVAGHPKGMRIGCVFEIVATREGGGSKQFDFSPPDKDGWQTAEHTFGNWESFTKFVKFNWSKVRVDVVIFLDESQDDDVVVWVDDVRLFEAPSEVEFAPIMNAEDPQKTAAKSQQGSGREK